MNKKTIIKVWKGRAFLHEEYIHMGLPCEKDTPLGSNPEFIKKLRDKHDCDVIFLNDDFSVSKLSNAGTEQGKEFETRLRTQKSGQTFGN